MIAAPRGIAPALMLARAAGMAGSQPEDGAERLDLVVSPRDPAIISLPGRRGRRCLPVPDPSAAAGQRNGAGREPGGGARDPEADHRGGWGGPVRAADGLTDAERINSGVMVGFHVSAACIARDPRTVSRLFVRAYRRPSRTPGFPTRVPPAATSQSPCWQALWGRVMRTGGGSGTG